MRYLVAHATSLILEVMKAKRIIVAGDSKPVFAWDPE